MHVKLLVGENGYINDWIDSETKRPSFAQELNWDPQGESDSLNVKISIIHRNKLNKQIFKIDSNEY